MRWLYRSLLALCSLVCAIQAHAFDAATFASTVTDRRWVCAHPICKPESPERNRHGRVFITSLLGTCQTITELVKGLLTGSSENGLLNTPTRVNST